MSQSANYTGVRVTDAVTYFRHRGEMRGTVHVVRTRTPDRLRWRAAVGAVNQVAAVLTGKDRMRVEEPVRELILDLPDRDLRREVVLDARRVGVDLDRGEVLKRFTVGDLGRLSFLTGTDVGTVRRYVSLSDDFFAPIDTAGVAVVGRALADQHRRRAHKLLLSIPDPDSGEPVTRHHAFIAERAEQDAELSRRWTALTRALLG
ncbi:MAG: hypothetical protein IPK60_18695 [Sandaracinaceae bacterium]|jgi:hypothetical protein|nr:hypothetical protein [Sandaracinaceae bacterium]